MITSLSRALMVFPLLALTVVAQDASRFNRDVRPILSANCFFCHGPDARARKGDLRLDNRDAALEKKAFVPGDAAASELIRRITTTDPDDHMPPIASELKLSEHDVDVLTRWIAAGAEYEPHWAFTAPPDVVPLPTITDPERWARTPIDAYVLEHLNSEGLAPSPPADKETLLRRATFDLTGLPPTLSELDNFLADNEPGAFERCVDRLLASPAYGERMAVDWMDAARYADTFGYQADVEMNVWPWRDWVIRAFNNNLPYSDFITWQLAGDLLPNPTQEQRLATTFNRLHRQTNEGGSINEEFRSAYVSDRTETVATAFLGLTMNCAKCHDHKFDPFTQRDYYSLSAFFANIDESGLYAHFVHPAPTPAMPLYKDGEFEKHTALKDAIAKQEQALADVTSAANDRLDAWLNDPAKQIVDPKPVVYWPLDTIENNTTPDLAVPDHKANLALAPTPVPGVDGQALHFNGDNGVESPAAGDFDRSQPFSLSLWINLETITPRQILLHHTKAETDAGSRGWELLLNEGRPQFALIHFWPGNAVRVLAKDPLPTGQWVHLAATYDGSSRADGLRLYVNGAQLETSVVRDHLYKNIRYEGGGTSLTLANRFRDSGFKGSVDEVRVYDAALSQVEVAALANRHTLAEEFSAAPRELQAAFYTQRIDPATNDARTQLTAARRAESDFIETVQNIMTMEELPTPRETHILTRGAYDHPGDVVSMDTPHGLPPFPNGAPRNRLGLAQWLTDPHHPLTARVAVNRYWQLFFGRGLVETQEDFGSQGKAPTHPELLDYLARNFIDTGWDLKALCKQIVLSKTYQQSSASTADLRARDPYNTLLARGPSFRLSAEQIRDAALAASGLLNRKIGGPSVYPYQPAGLWEDAASMGYPQSSGADLYRRGLYTFVKRTVPPPASLTFDGVTRETCIVRRERTMTPLQALMLLNDPQYVEAARVLAESTLAAAFAKDADPGSSSPTNNQQLTTNNFLPTLFRTLTSHTPTPEELAVLSDTYAEQLAWYAEHPDDAAKFAKAGAAPRNESLDPTQVAATTALAQAILNLDDFQMRR